MLLKQVSKLSIISCAFSLIACGGGGESSSKNQLPTVTSSNVSVNENASVSLSANATDNDGSITSYSWKVTSGHVLTLNGATSNSVSFIAPSVDDAGDTVNLEVTVTDNDDGSAKTNVSVSVENVKPIVSIEDLTVNEKERVAVTANVDNQEDGIASYQWQQISGPSVTLENSNSATLTFIAPEVHQDEVVGLSLAVTDNDGDVSTIDGAVNVSQLTLPLTLKGSIANAKVANAEVTVRVAGQETSGGTIVDENGAYTIDLLLDDSQAGEMISVVGKGVENQANAGLISLLGTAEHLSQLAGEDNILTQQEHFAVNVSNFTTAQYALSKFANQEVEISSQEQLESLMLLLDYNDVVSLATAIKVAIEKPKVNVVLNLPEGIHDTLALVNNANAMQSYLREIQHTLEFHEAQTEIYQEAEFVDPSSTWELPDSYYLVSPDSYLGGDIMYFTAGNTGKVGFYEFTWEQVDGKVVTTTTDGREINYALVENEQVEVHTIDTSYVLKRLSRGEKFDVILQEKSQLKHYPGGEFQDVVSTHVSTYAAIRNASTVGATHEGAGVAYLPFSYLPTSHSVENLSYLIMDEFVLNEDGTGHATVHDIDFTWQMNNGELQLALPSDFRAQSNIASWKQLTVSKGSPLFAHRFIADDEVDTIRDYVSEGKILKSRNAWDATAGAGVYTYAENLFRESGEIFWLELRENGEADTVIGSDKNADGVYTDNELSVWLGSWEINADGSLTIRRATSEGENRPSDCRYASTEGCELYHERVMWLISEESNAFSVMHKHDYVSWENRYAYIDSRTFYKTDSIPGNVAESIQKTRKISVLNKHVDKTAVSKLKQLEPSSLEDLLIK